MNRTPAGLDEVKAISARAYGPDCIGCKKFDATVMVSFFSNGEDEVKARFRDVFLDLPAAELFYRELGRVLDIVRQKP